MLKTTKFQGVCTRLQNAPSLEIELKPLFYPSVWVDQRNHPGVYGS